MLARRLHPRVDRQHEGEHASLVDPARHPHVSAVKGGEPLREGKPETCSFVLAAWSGIDLVEFLEDLFQVRLGDADPGIGDRDLDGVLRAHGIDRHGPVFGCELDRVGDEVQQHLLQLAAVGQHLAGAIDLGQQRDVLLRDQRLDRLADLVDSFCDRHEAEAQLHLTGFDLGEVEDIVDQSEQVLAAGEDLAQESLPRRVVELALARVREELGESDDRVQRGAELMAHVGEEHALVPVRLLQRDVPLLELGHQVTAVESGHERAHQLLRAVHLVAAEAGRKRTGNDDERARTGESGHRQRDHAGLLA